MEPDQKRMSPAEISRRTRYYHALMDRECLESGEEYERLKNVIVIFILSDDPFGMRRMVYTICNMCREVPELPYDDGARTLFLYTKGTELYEILGEGGGDTERGEGEGASEYRTGKAESRARETEGRTGKAESRTCGKREAAGGS